MNTAGMCEVHTAGMCEVHTAGMCEVHTAGMCEVHTAGMCEVHTAGMCEVHTAGMWLFLWIDCILYSFPPSAGADSEEAIEVCSIFSLQVVLSKLVTFPNVNHYFHLLRTFNVLSCWCKR